MFWLRNCFIFALNCLFVCCFFFFQAEDGIRDTSVTGVQTCALPISLRQRPGFLYCQFLVAAAPHFLYCPVFVAAAPLVFILPGSRCGSAPAFYTAHFSLRQRPSFLSCPFLAAEAPPLFLLPISLCGSAHFFFPPPPCY